MNTIVKTAAAALLTLGLAVAGLPLGSGGISVMSGSTGCCKTAN